MANTTIATTDALRKEQWEEKLFRDTMVESFFMGRFAGYSVQNLLKGMPFDSTPNDILHVVTKLESKGKTKTREGDKITFGLIPRISPTTHPGVTSGQTLKGKEVALTWYNFSLELERYRQAVSAGTPIDWHRAAFAMAPEGRAALLNWGIEKLDVLSINALDVSTYSKIFYKTSSGVQGTDTWATAKAALTAADGKLTPAMVSFIGAWCKTGGGRARVPIRPIYVDGKPYLVWVVHPDVLYDWKQDSTVFQAWREAQARGNDNPIFRGASYIWDNNVIHEYENITTGTDAGTGAIPYAKCHVLGAQALCWAWGERPSLVEDTEDYEEELYYAWRMTGIAGKPNFNSLDYGSVMVALARTNVSGT